MVSSSKVKNASGILQELFADYQLVGSKQKLGPPKVGRTSKPLVYKLTGRVNKLNGIK